MLCLNFVIQNMGTWALQMTTSCISKQRYTNTNLIETCLFQGFAVSGSTREYWVRSTNDVILRMETEGAIFRGTNVTARAGDK